MRRLAAPKAVRRGGELRAPRVAFLGHFGGGNLGNEATLQAILYQLRLHHPDASVLCVCSDPEQVSLTYGVEAIPFSPPRLEAWAPAHPVARRLRKLLVGGSAELLRWVAIARVLRRVDMLIVPGTGLLTDVAGLLGWGPYTVFKWSLLAKLCRRRLLCVSVGAGPLYRRLARWLVRAALRLADFRSYRDASSQRCLQSIGVPAERDPLAPDLAFGLPENLLQGEHGERRRPVVGVGVMRYPGGYSAARPSPETERAYVEALATATRSWLAQGYDVRLLIGDLADVAVERELQALVSGRTPAGVDGSLIDEPVRSVEELIAQIARTDVVVATRFHNAVLALACGKPVLSISFHDKCASLMRDLGLSPFCLDIHELSADRLLGAFRELAASAGALRPLVRTEVEARRRAVESQCAAVFGEGRSGPRVAGEHRHPSRSGRRAAATFAAAAAERVEGSVKSSSGLRRHRRPTGGQLPEPELWRVAHAHLADGRRLADDARRRIGSPTMLVAEEGGGARLLRGRRRDRVARRLLSADISVRVSQLWSSVRSRSQSSGRASSASQSRGS